MIKMIAYQSHCYGDTQENDFDQNGPVLQKNSNMSPLTYNIFSPLCWEKHPTVAL